MFLDSLCTNTELNVLWPIHIPQPNLAETHPVVFVNTDSQFNQATDRQGENVPSLAEVIPHSGEQVYGGEDYVVLTCIIIGT